MRAAGSDPGEVDYLGRLALLPDQGVQQASARPSGEEGLRASSPGKEEQQQGSHLGELGCQPTVMQSGSRGSGRAGKQTHQGPFFDHGPGPPSTAAAWVLSRRRVAGQQLGPKQPCPGGLH